MNRNPLWRYVLLIIVIGVGALFAAPNLYQQDPALQVSLNKKATSEGNDAQLIRDALSGGQIEPLAMDENLDGLLVRFSDTDQQAKAQELLEASLGETHSTAMLLAPTTPSWLQNLGAKPMYLGLDLRGGVHFLMEVDMVAVKRQAEERFVADIKTTLREEKIRYLPFGRRDGGGISVRLRDSTDQGDAYSAINNKFPELNLTEVTPGGRFEIDATVKDEALSDIGKFALQQNITTLRKRVNELGVAEPIIQQQGQSRVVVQLPGVQDPRRAKEILGATATLEFRMVDTEHEVRDAVDGNVPARSKLYRERNGQPVLLKKDIMLTGECIIDASSGIEQQNGSPAVFITLTGPCSKSFARATRDQIGRPMGVVFIENNTVTVRRGDELVRESKLTEEVINIATIRDQLSKRFQISGLDSTQEARDLALLLRAGALAAPIEIIEERTVGPGLGQDNINRGRLSVQLGFVFVLVFMALYYKVFGLVADLALALNLVLLVALLSIMQATLTLPGIAGIVLTVGMAVDANVLIFERIREELRNGVSPQASIKAGYQKAFSTIADANITTLIAAVVLFSFGTGPIKGFAVTLSLGIVTSMFTAILGTRVVVNLIYGGKQAQKLAI